MTKKGKKILKAVFGFMGIMIIYEPILWAIEYFCKCEFSYNIHMMPIYICMGMIALGLYICILIFSYLLFKLDR